MSGFRGCRKILGYGFVIFMMIVSVAVVAFAADRVKHCYDGDTFVLESGKKVRLAGIDTPETGKDGERDQFYAEQSRKKLIALVQGKVVRLGPSVGKQSYGRDVVEVFLQDGRSVNEIMVRDGAAFFYYHKDIPQKLQDTLLKAQRLALREKKGMWAGVLKSASAKKKYVGNKNSKRFFSQQCKSLNDVATRNRVSFNSLAGAFEAGFSPVRACNIWPLD